MLCMGEGIPYDFRSMEAMLLAPRMSQQTESSGESSPEQSLTAPPPGFGPDSDDTSSLLDGPTPVPSAVTMAAEEEALAFEAEVDFQISTMAVGRVYSDYYDRIREDAEWNEHGQMTYVPLYTPRTSHGSFSSDRLSSEGSVSPTLPSPIGDHLKAKRDSSSSLQFPIVAGAPQAFPDPAAERAAAARDGLYSGNGNGRGGGAKPYATIMEPKGDYGMTAAGEYGSSSQDSQTDVFGGSQESLNQGYGGATGYDYGGEYGRGGGGGYGRQQQRVGNHNGGGGGRMAAAPRRQQQQHYGGGGYGSNGYADYSSSYASYEQTSYDSWRGDAFESTNKYGGPIASGGNGHGYNSHNGGGGRHTPSSSMMAHHSQHSFAVAAAAAAAPAGPLPTAFSRANINDEQKNNLMANLTRLCNQRSY